MITWKKSGESGLAHVVDRKGLAHFITICGTLIRTDKALDAPEGERCPNCEHKSLEGRAQDAKAVITTQRGFLADDDRV